MSGPRAWMPLWIGDYLGDTPRLTTEQHGAYVLLMLDYWLNGPPPADDAVLARITRLDRARWKRHAAAIRAYFREEGGLLHHAQLDQERAEAQDKYEQACERARRAARKRWGGEGQGAGDAAGDAAGNAGGTAGGNDPGTASGMPGDCQSPSPSPSPSPGEASSARAASDPEVPSSSSALGAAAPPKKKKAAAQPGTPATDAPEDPVPTREVCLPLADGRVFAVSREWTLRLQGQFTAVDVAQQLRLMQAWLEANPEQRKTTRHIRRFVTGWLGREQAKAPPRPAVAYLGAEDLL